MQSVFVIVTKLIASKSYLCKEVFCKNFGRNGTMNSMEGGVFLEHIWYVTVRAFGGAPKERQ